ncbi:MAG: hypothetical protein ACFFBD_27355 [Candidatus Hodarchaeota archaeon]
MVKESGRVPRKLTVRIEKEIKQNTLETQQLILRKGSNESFLHILLKLLAFIYFWDIENELVVEPRKFHRYRPDLISWRPSEIPTQITMVPDVWVECKYVKIEKLIRLGHQFPNSKIYWFHKYNHFLKQKENLPPNINLIGVETIDNTWNHLEYNLTSKRPYWRFKCSNEPPKTIQIRTNEFIGKIIYRILSSTKPNRKEKT